MNATGSILTATMRRHQANTGGIESRAATWHGSRTEGAPVAHNRYKPVSLYAPECGDDGTARDTVFAGQSRDRGQPLLSLPFARVDPCT